MSTVVRQPCAICDLLAEGPEGQKPLNFAGINILTPRSHVPSWAQLPPTEQFALMGEIAGVLGDTSKAALALVTDSVDGHFLIRLQTQPAFNPPNSQPRFNRLIAGGSDPLLPHLIRQIDTSHKVDLAVAFALDSGVAMLEPYLDDLLMRGGELRVVVGDYFDVTEPAALRRLMDLDGNVQRFVFETRGGSFHPKAWVFRDGNAVGSAIVGSSNLTSTALLHGVEWNLQSGVEPADWQDVQRAFEELLGSPNVQPLTQEWIDGYAGRRRTKALPEFAKAVTEESPAEPVPTPHDVQVRALQALAETRDSGHRAGLVVLATGLGKTWLAAFDSEAFHRVLFVAHREEILTQAMHTFRRIRPEARFGRYTGETKEDGDIIFASVQTLGKQQHLDRYAPDAFDYIVVDEFHHAAAKTYRALLDHFEPAFLLGLTATPERSDGGDLLGLCGENLVFECGLFAGVNSGHLAPFRYFGVPDDIDYEQIPWRSSRFDEEALTTALATNKRAQNALEQFQKHAQGPAIGFCCSRRHANFMADYFTKAGLRAAAVHSGEDSAPRTSTLEALGRGELDILFSVDMFNEGVDVPRVGTVMMLRPTESTILFLQQLGRGLRRAEGKTHLQVIDYIGNHRAFLTKARALLQAGEGNRSLSKRLDEVQRGEFALPAGCSITYELEAMDFLRAMLRERPDQSELEAFYQDFKLRKGVRPTAAETAHADFHPARTGHGSWFEFVRDMGDMPAGGVLTTHGELLSMLGRTRFTSADPLLVLKAATKSLNDGVNVDRLRGIVEGLSTRWPELGTMDDARFDNGLQFWLTTPHFVVANNRLVLARADNSNSLFDLVEELVDWRMAEFLSKPGPSPVGPEDKAGRNSGPELWRAYMREAIPPLFGAAFSPGNWNAGIVRVGVDLVLLTTLNKGSLSSGSHYEDRFTSPTRMQWQSQTQTRRESEQGLTLSGQKPGASVFLFVRGEKMRDSRAAPFIYCGQPRFLSWEGDRPITIQWELAEPVPDHLHQMLGLR